VLAAICASAAEMSEQNREPACPWSRLASKGVLMKVTKPGSTILYPVPAVLVSCGTEKPNIITLAWVGTLCSDPPAVGIGVRAERYSHGLIAKAGEFVVNLPRADQVDVVDYCGHVSGRDVDKWAACGLTPAPASQVRVPLIAECPVALECRVTQRMTLGSHDLFVGQVLAVQLDDTVLDAHGRLDQERAQPLAYGGGYYWQLAERLGRFGDWRGGVR
jgi:flavin reductase (DIM6/NTAB) family NADH-FMN oxidoreductase RutF